MSSVLVWYKPASLKKMNKNFFYCLFKFPNIYVYCKESIDAKVGVNKSFFFT